MSNITYQRGVISSLGDDTPHEDFHVLCDGHETGLGYFRDPAPRGASNQFTVQVNGRVSNVAIHRSSDEQDWYVLVHVESGMTFRYLLQREVQVRQQAQGMLALGLDWTQPVAVLQQHPLWNDVGERNKEIVEHILGKRVF